MRMNRTCIIHSRIRKLTSKNGISTGFFLTDGMGGNFGNPFAHIYFPNGGEREIAARMHFCPPNPNPPITSSQPDSPSPQHPIPFSLPKTPSFHLQAFIAVSKTFPLSLLFGQFRAQARKKSQGKRFTTAFSLATNQKGIFPLHLSLGGGRGSWHCSLPVYAQKLLAAWLCRPCFLGFFWAAAAFRRQRQQQQPSKKMQEGKRFSKVKIRISLLSKYFCNTQSKDIMRLHFFSFS